MKDEFLAMLSHELRTPLSAIVGWAHMLRTGGLDEPTVARAIETIDRNAKVQNQLIEDILDVSRIVAGKFHLEMELAGDDARDVEDVLDELVLDLRVAVGGLDGARDRRLVQGIGRASCRERV